MKDIRKFTYISFQLFVLVLLSIAEVEQLADQSETVRNIVYIFNMIFGTILVMYFKSYGARKMFLSFFWSKKQYAYSRRWQRWDRKFYREYEAMLDADLSGNIAEFNRHHRNTRRIMRVQKMFNDNYPTIKNSLIPNKRRFANKINKLEQTVKKEKHKFYA